MFTVKLIKESIDSGEEIVILREASKVTIHPNELFLQNPINGNVYFSVKKSEDYDRAYVMNANGSTVETI